jgi:hypothetical protein
MLDDLGSAISLVQPSLYLPEGPMPVLLGDRNNTFIDNADSTLFSADPERREFSGKRA